MADYSRLAYNPEFTPFTYLELSTPLLEMEARLDAIENAYSEMSDLEILDTVLANEPGIGAEKAKQLVQSYKNELTRLVDLLLKFGVLGTSKEALNNLKKYYKGKIEPLKLLIDERRAEITKQRDARNEAMIRGINMIYDNDLSNISVDQMLANPTGWSNYNSLNLTALEEDSKMLGATLAAMSQRTDLTDTEKGFLNLITTQGYDLNTLNRMITEGKVPSQLIPLILNLYTKYASSGFNFNEQTQELANAAINQGLAMGMAQKQESKLVENPNYTSSYLRDYLDLQKRNLALLEKLLGIQYNEETGTYENSLNYSSVEVSRLLTKEEVRGTHIPEGAILGSDGSIYLERTEGTGKNKRVVRTKLDVTPDDLMLINADALEKDNILKTRETHLSKINNGRFYYKLQNDGNKYSKDEALDGLKLIDSNINKGKSGKYKIIDGALYAEIVDDEGKQSKFSITPVENNKIKLLIRGTKYHPSNFIIAMDYWGKDEIILIDKRLIDQIGALELNNLYNEISRFNSAVATTIVESTAQPTLPYESTGEVIDEDASAVEQE